MKSALKLISNNTDFGDSKLRDPQKQIEGLEEKISILELETEDKEQQWRLFMEHLQVLFKDSLRLFQLFNYTAFKTFLFKLR